MDRTSVLNVLACAAAGITAAAALSASIAADGARPHADTSKAFNGTSLAGWHPRGAAQWRVANGEIVGAAASGPGQLVLDKSYQDIVVEFAFQCQGCDAGVLLRDAPTVSPNGAASNAGAFDVGIAGAGALTLSRVSVDGQGKELERAEWFKWTSRRNPPGLQLSITPGANGWQHVRIQVRGDVTRPQAPGGAAGGGAAAQRAASGAGAAEKEVYPTYGPLALRLTSGELRVKDVTVVDLLRPPAGVAPEMTASNFKRVQLTDRFYAEGISAGDINKDGVVDAVSGPYGYLGPAYERAVEIYRPSVNPIANPTNGGHYTDNFLNYVYDFTGDGWNDYLKVNFNGAYLYVNPKGESRYWSMFQVTEVGVSSETTQLGDIDGDGKSELLGSIGSAANRVIGYWKPGADATARWTWVPISEKGDWGGHGYGLGDLNDDGKVDIIQGSGWWAQPAAGAASGVWAFTPVPFGRGTDAFIRGADMFAYDVNGDKLPDVITSLFAHGPGLVWFEQQKAAGGAVTWKMHMIMDRPEASADERKTWEIADKSFVFTELHAVQVIDMDGDGLKDIVSGKRWLSHGFEWGENDRDDPPVVAWFKLVRKAGGQVEFVPHVINNYVGLGTQIAVTDVNGDSRPDVLTAARKGAHIFLNNIPRATGKSSGTAPQ
jgi:hypothetical protein